jgi:hypothetical protein
LFDVGEQQTPQVSRYIDEVKKDQTEANYFYPALSGLHDAFASSSSRVVPRNEGLLHPFDILSRHCAQIFNLKSLL